MILPVSVDVKNESFALQSIRSLLVQLVSPMNVPYRCIKQICVYSYAAFWN